MPETDKTEGRTDAPFTEAATGAESTYVHGGQRPLENPPKSGAADVTQPVQDQLNEMHVDSKLSSGEPPIPGSAPDPETTWREDDTRFQARRDFGHPAGNSSADPTKVGALIGGAGQLDQRDEFGRTPEQLQELQRKREEAFKAQDGNADARRDRTQAINDAANATRDRTLAVQEEIATRERDGAVPGTPAFERRKARIREIVGQTDDGADGLSQADRIRNIASRLHTQSGSGIEEMQHELMALADEMEPAGSRKAVA